MKGVSMRFTPAATPDSASARSSDERQECVATSAAEQAVSIERHGPCRPSAKERRPDATE